MHLDGWTVLLQAINLAVLLGLLRWLLYKPLLAVIDKRQQRVAAEMAAAETSRQEAEQQAQRLATQSAALESNREQVLSDAKLSAEAERQALMASAKSDLQAERVEALKEIDKERQLASHALMVEASSMAVDLATRLIESSPTPLNDADFIEALLEHMKSTPPQDRHRWLGDVRPAPVTLVCASTPSESTVQKVKTQLNQLLETEVDLHPETHPALLRGAELHFEHGVLSQSWASELAAAKAEMRQSAT